MPIPKQIFQTFRSRQLPWITMYHIARLKRLNPEYAYHFYDDEMILEFLENEFPSEYLRAYNRLTIGAGKADFFRYAVLYKKGGVYLDLDVKVVKPFREFVLDSDQAIISNEIDKRLFVQWAMFFVPGHPFLEKTLENIIINIQERRYPNNIHATTGPVPFSDAIRGCLGSEPHTPYRLMGVYYNGVMKEKYKLAKIAIYKHKKNHWKKLQLRQEVVSHQ
ncbi:MAG TPA: glycosyltransferase [Edaphocola sp.]|nr:glycosyltransferase [Edaphocola sp.]